MEIAGNSVIVSRVPLEKEPGLMIGTFADAMQTRIRAEYQEKYPRTHPMGAPQLGYERYSAAEGYSDSYDHFHNFFSSVRSRQPVVEDAVFGFRAAGAALLSNLSYEHGAVVHWDPEAMKLV
jgi:hypothetical protein